MIALSAIIFARMLNVLLRTDSASGSVIMASFVTVIPYLILLGLSLFLTRFPISLIVTAVAMHAVIASGVWFKGPQTAFGDNELWAYIFSFPVGLIVLLIGMAVEFKLRPTKEKVKWWEPPQKRRFTTAGKVIFYVALVFLVLGPGGLNAMYLLAQHDSTTQLVYEAKHLGDRAAVEGARLGGNRSAELNALIKQARQKRLQENTRLVEPAMKDIDDALAIARELSDRHTEAGLLSAKGELIFFSRLPSGDRSADLAVKATIYLDSARNVFHKIGDVPGEALALSRIAYANGSTSRRAFNDLLALARERDDDWLEESTIQRGWYYNQYIQKLSSAELDSMKAADDALLRQSAVPKSVRDTCRFKNEEPLDLTMPGGDGMEEIEKLVKSGVAYMEGNSGGFATPNEIFGKAYEIARRKKNRKAMAEIQSEWGNARSMFYTESGVEKLEWARKVFHEIGDVEGEKLAEERIASAENVRYKGYRLPAPRPKTWDEMSQAERDSVRSMGGDSTGRR